MTTPSRTRSLAREVGGVGLRFTAEESHKCSFRLLFVGKNLRTDSTDLLDVRQEFAVSLRLLKWILPAIFYSFFLDL
ncbi:TPA: hypothetical protein DEP34_03700 [Candidatus Uhrbacteria bacterium]|nr:hypothetical protein [Candidatus Uhrbacteria bacterium]HCB19460.1 hypothetical protein [Candidatus Uhrbacteria bacterium]